MTFLSLKTSQRQSTFYILTVTSVFATILLSGCSTAPTSKNLDLIPVTFDELPGWHQDQQGKALPALQHTCRVLSKKADGADMITGADGQGQAQDWKPFCRKLEQKIKDHGFKNHGQIRRFMETNLTPYQVALSGDTKGTFTGYYVPVLRGSLKRHGPYQTPLYRLPKKGTNAKISRTKIVRGAFKGKGLELVWVDDPIEAFFVQIQGSGRIRLDDGREMRIGYVGQNGFPYFPIGKELIDRGALSTDRVNMHTIKKWLRDHPKQAEQVMSKNQSYVYFKEMKGPGPIGAHGVPLTPHRSMAVDRQFVSLGTPLWLDAEHPYDKRRMQQLMVAQDIGGAIKGAVRGDYFWGLGDQAGKNAGRMNSSGEMYLLLPR